MKTSGLLNSKQVAHKFGISLNGWYMRQCHGTAPKPVGKIGRSHLWNEGDVAAHFQKSPYRPEKARLAEFARAARRKKREAQQSFELEPAVEQTITAPPPPPVKEMDALDLISAAEAGVMKDCTSREMRMARSRLEEAAMWAAKHYDNVTRTT